VKPTQGSGPTPGNGPPEAAGTPAPAPGSRAASDQATGAQGTNAQGTPAQGAGAQDVQAAAAEARIAELTARIAEVQDQRLRALADADNARKRCAAQVSRAEAAARAAAARQWLPVIDNLDLALTHATADPAAIVEGIRAVRHQALDVLAGMGFPRRDDRGARFDPARHEAVASRPDPGVTADLVAEVVRPAYGEGDRQLRPAQVVVARPG
jgi:molecular chaperone GrpE